MITSTEFQKKYFENFNNSDLGMEIEKHLDNVQSNDGKVLCEYGYDQEIDSWFIDVEDHSYWYSNLDERNADIIQLEDVITKFRISNNTKHKNPIWAI